MCDDVAWGDPFPLGFVLDFFRDIKASKIMT